MPRKYTSVDSWEMQNKLIRFQNVNIFFVFRCYFAYQLTSKLSFISIGKRGINGKDDTVCWNGKNVKKIPHSMTKLTEINLFVVSSHIKLVLFCWYKLLNAYIECFEKEINNMFLLEVKGIEQKIKLFAEMVNKKFAFRIWMTFLFNCFHKG